MLKEAVMHTEHLAYLREIVKRRSMNTASKKLHVAQQTLSTAVKSLEKELDAKLLERTYHGVYPTPIGQEVVDLADEILSKIDYLAPKYLTANRKKDAKEFELSFENVKDVFLNDDLSREDQLRETKENKLMQNHGSHQQLHCDEMIVSLN